MSTYVINNRIPRFPVRDGYADRPSLQKRLEAAFQVWLKERFISNLARRKVCSQVYDFAMQMEAENKVVEDSQAGDFAAFCVIAGLSPQAEWGDFLRYGRLKVPELAWQAPQA